MKDKLLYFLVLANILGFFSGLYFYSPQLLDTSPIMWLLVIDCPLQVILFSIILFFEPSHPLPGFVKYFNFVGLIKYGFWTVFVSLLYFNLFFTYDPILSSVRVILHIAMALEALLLLRLFQPDVYSLVLVVFLYLLNDASDYIYGTLPRIPAGDHALLFAESLLVSILLPVLVFALCRGSKRPFFIHAPK